MSVAGFHAPFAHKAMVLKRMNTWLLHYKDHIERRALIKSNPKI
jgi:hypothetical protein